MSDARKNAELAMQNAGLTITSVFVPWSQSRSKGDNNPSLNWRVTLLKGERKVLTTDYMAGSGHCPASKLSVKQAGNHNSIMRDEMIRHECETGQVYRHFSNIGFTPTIGVKKIEPDACDVMYSLIMDASVLDAGTFEEWAADFGYYVDSRSAEKTYRACLDIALKLRAGLGDDTLRALREAFQDY